MLDSIPTSLLKEEAVIEKLVQVMCNIVNTCLSSGSVPNPDVLNVANVTPLIKKPTLNIKD
jgi:hypothetical protein